MASPAVVMAAVRPSGLNAKATTQLADAEGAYGRADGCGYAPGAHNLVVLLKQRGELDAAEAAWRRADERGDPAGAYSLGVLLKQRGDRSVRLWDVAGDALLVSVRLGSPARAVAQSDRALAVGVGRAVAYFRIAERQGLDETAGLQAASHTDR